MNVNVQFFSYFKQLTGTSATTETLPAGATVADLLRVLAERFPKLRGGEKSTLVAIGVEYATKDQVLREGDEVSVFPPVQGG
jgi:molybdopterin converting factor subunit 1